MLLSFILALDCEELEPAPFNGTIFIDNDIITPDDPNNFCKTLLQWKGFKDHV